MPAAIAEPPAAPAQEKPAAPAPPSAPGTVKEPEAKPAKPYESPNDELDRLFGDPAKPKVDPPEKEDPKDQKKPEETPKDQEKPADEPKKEEPKPAGSAKELRTALDNTKKELALARAELEKVKSAKPEDPERSTLLQKLEAESKRREELEKEIQFVSYEKSQEYTEKFRVPLENAFSNAYKEVVEFKITNEDGTTRQATEDDFNRLLYLSTPDALAMAKQLFGDGHTEIMAHRRFIKQMDESRRHAIEKHKTEAKTRDESQRLQQEQAKARYQKLYEDTLKDQAEKYPKAFAPQEGEEEGNRLLEKGKELVDLAFSDSNIPPEQRIQLHATIRNKAIAFDRMVWRNKQMEEKISALEKELAEFQKSSPQAGDGTEQTPSGPVSWMDEIDQMAKKAS